jgi:hypothetical protein
VRAPDEVTFHHKVQPNKVSRILRIRPDPANFRSRHNHPIQLFGYIKSLNRRLVFEVKLSSRASDDVLITRRP